MTDTSTKDTDDPLKKRINKILESRLDTDKVNIQFNAVIQC